MASLSQISGFHDVNQWYLCATDRLVARAYPGPPEPPGEGGGGQRPPGAAAHLGDREEGKGDRNHR